MYAIYVNGLLATRTETPEEAEQIVLARFFHRGAVIIPEGKGA